MSSQIIFERYLAAAIPGDDPETILESLLVDHAKPVLERVVRNRLGALYTAGDAAELSSEAMLELLARLRTLRESAEPARMPFEGLVRGVAANTVHRYFARRFPERNRLRKKLRYIISTNDRFRLRTGPDGVTVCGLAAEGAEENEAQARASDVQRCLERLRSRAVAVHPLGPLVGDILRELGGPIDLSRLTSLVAELIGLREPSWDAAAAEGVEALDLPEDFAVPAPLRMELRERLEQMWNEVLLLSEPHRNALLLSARASSGAAIWLVVDLGIASFREAASALGMSIGELAAVWNSLPLEDHAIARRLGVERQQVINLRCSARARLIRRQNQAASDAKGNK